MKDHQKPINKIIEPPVGGSNAIPYQTQPVD
jgi:hypothetical protein